MNRFDRATIAGSAILIPSILGLCMDGVRSEFWGMLGAAVGLLLVASGLYEFRLPGAGGSASKDELSAGNSDQ